MQPVYPTRSGGRRGRPQLHTYQLPVAVTRFANIYGGGDLNFSRLVPETVSAVMEGRRPVIRSDSPERDFLYVEDVAPGPMSPSPSAGRGAARARPSTPAGGTPMRCGRWSS